MDTIFFMIIVFLSSLGLLYFFNLLKNVFLDDAEDIKNLYNFKIIPLSDDIENIEYMIRKYYSRESNKKYFRQTEVIFLFDDCDSETKKILENMKQTYKFTICEKGQIYSIIEDKLKNLKF